MRFISVDLPDPEGAHDGDVLVVADAQIDAAECIDLLIAHLVGLPEIVGDDDISRVWGRHALVRLGSSSVSMAIRFSGYCLC